MDEEVAVVNGKWKNEKTNKPKSEKDKMSDESAMGILEAHNVDKMKAIESAQISEKEDIADEKRDIKRGQKKKKNIRTRDLEADIIKDSNEGNLTGVNRENSGGLTRDNAERKKKNKKREKSKNKNDDFEGKTEEVMGNEKKKWVEGENVSNGSKETDKERKKQKVKINNEDVDMEGERDGEGIGTHSENCKFDAPEMVKRKKKEKGKQKNKDDNVIGLLDNLSEVKHGEDDLSPLQQENTSEKVGDDVQSTVNDGNDKKVLERKKKKKYKKKESYKDDSSAAQQDSADNDSSFLMHTEKIPIDEGKRKKKKTKFVEGGSRDGQDNVDEYANKGKKRKNTLVENGSGDATPNKSNKKVRFSGKVEVFPLPSNLNTEKGNDEEDNLVRGKRFSREEDDIVKDAVMKYIREHELGDRGLDMILKCIQYPELKGCWREIGAAIPYRPYVAVYNRARIIFMRSDTRKWTQEEYDMILKYQEEHGNQWKALADELGKHTWHVKDTYRRIKLPDLKKGSWSQREYQKLFDLVNTDLQLKVSEEKKSKHGMLLDNIAWSAISDELSTRNQAACCLKWYKQLTSPMVAEGVWVDSDDYRLLSALYDLDATCMEDVDWDDLVESRSGDLCRKRWNQMVLHIGQHGNKSFAEQVETLAQRYCPHLLAAREAWESKPRVP